MPAKVVSIRVRPLGVTHLCFETDGILGDINLSLNPNSLGLLGATAPFFDFDVFYAELAARPTQPAVGSITFASNPGAGQIITLDGTTWTFVTTLTTGNQLLIGATLAATLTGAVSTLQASNDPNTENFRFSATATALVLTAATDGPGGNSLAFSTNVAGATVSAPTLLGADPSRLRFDSLTIQAQVAPYALATLRAEPKKAALNKAILLRQNTYFAKYANSDNIIARMLQYYFNPPDLGLPGPPNPFSKSYRLAALSDTAEDQWAALNAAYGNAHQQGGAAGVVDDIVSKLTSDVIGYGYTASSARATETSVSAGGPLPSGSVTDPSAPAPPDPWTPPSPWPPTSWEGVDAPGPTPGQWAGTWNPGFPAEPQVSKAYQQSTSYSVDSNDTVSHEQQTMTTTNKEFRHPFYEAQARYQRAQVSLVDQQFAAFMSAQNLPHLATVFTNELLSIDSEVYKLQIAYLNTILLSPFPGIVTGVYKYPGDAVRAGEPVLRVENISTILLDTVLIYQGPIVVGTTTASITTALFGDSSGQPTTISGLVVAARGQEADDKWHVVIECNNMNNSNPPQPIFPPGYRFDSDDTTITLT
jgi:biotin carboxyl carrier protein